MKKVIIFFLTTVLILGCEQKKKTNAVSEQLIERQDTNSVEVQTSLAKMNEIDLMVIEENLTEVRSLRWEKTHQENSSFVEVLAYINDKGFPLKIIELYSSGNFGKEGQNIYYLENNEVFASVEVYDEWIDSNYTVIHERQNFLIDEKPTFSRMRSADYADELEAFSWKTIRAETPSPERAYDILSGEKEFKTHFLSLIQGEESLFILLGEPKKENRYVTAARVDAMTPFIVDLLENKKEYLYRPVKVQVEVVGGGSEPEFRVLRYAEWADN